MSRQGRGRSRGGRAQESGAANAAAPADPRQTLEAVKADPRLRGAHVVVRELIEKGIAACPLPNLRQQMVEQFTEMLQGKTSFAVLAGALRHLCLCCPAAKVSAAAARRRRRRRCQTAAAALDAASTPTAHPPPSRAQTRRSWRR